MGSPFIIQNGGADVVWGSRFRRSLHKTICDGTMCPGYTTAGFLDVESLLYLYMTATETSGNMTIWKNTCKLV